jgi:hypothetical protein
VPKKRTPAQEARWKAAVHAANALAAQLRELWPRPGTFSVGAGDKELIIYLHRQGLLKTFMKDVPKKFQELKVRVVTAGPIEMAGET